MTRDSLRRSMGRLTRLVSLGCLVLGMAGFVVQASSMSPEPSSTFTLHAQDGSSGEAFFLEVDGIINPVVQRYIARTLKKAEEEEAKLVIIHLDTPGGLLDSTRKIVTELLSASVPTAVYVAPQGARAASAGTFITAAANFAVMAPGTNIGAATPIASGGEDLPETLASKAINDAAALMRSIAKERNRNVEKLEQTVREATSYDAQEAVELEIVDFIAKDTDELLAKLDGRTADTAAGPKTIEIEEIIIRNVPMSVIDRFFNILADPNISFILFSIGGLAIVIELFNPGLIFPGVIGVILLILSFLSFGNLPVNWAATAFLLLAIALIVAEFYVAGFGVLGIGGIVSFILGTLLLFSQFGAPSPTLPPLSVSLWVLVPTVGGITALGAYVYVTIVQSRRAQPELAGSPLIGMEGVVTADLAPHGTVRLQNELWTAMAQGTGTIPAGERVKVVRVDGVILEVGRPEEEPQATDESA